MAFTTLTSKRGLWSGLYLCHIIAGDDLDQVCDDLGSACQVSTLSWEHVLKRRRYTLEQLTRAIATSVSIRQTLQKLDVKAAGGNYSVFHKAVRHFGLDTSHFTGRNLSGRKLPPRRKPLAEYLVRNSTIQSNKLRRYLLQQKVLKPVCSNCRRVSWLGRPIPLELDHRDGDPHNNDIANLRLLCPNCHALTPNYRGKNIAPKA